MNISNIIWRLFICVLVGILASCDPPKTNVTPTQNGFATAYISNHYDKTTDTIYCYDCSGSWGNGSNISLNFNCEDGSNWDFFMQRKEFAGAQTIYTALGNNRTDIDLFATGYNGKNWSMRKRNESASFGAKNAKNGIEGTVKNAHIISQNTDYLSVRIDFKKLK